MTGQNKKELAPSHLSKLGKSVRNPLRLLVYSSICVRTSKINYFFGGHIMTKSNQPITLELLMQRVMQTEKVSAMYQLIP